LVWLSSMVSVDAGTLALLCLLLPEGIAVLVGALSPLGSAEGDELRLLAGVDVGICVGISVCSGTLASPFSLVSICAGLLGSVSLLFSSLAGGGSAMLPLL